MGWLRRLIAAESGSIAVIGALSLSSVLGMSALAVEVGNGYAAKVRNQRVADMAALGAALAYKSSQSLSIATATAGDIVIANGLASSTATVSQVTVDGASGIKVQVTTAVPIRLGAMLSSAASYNVTNAAVASLTSNGTASCITALSANVTNAVTVTGGTSLVANGCSVTTNSGVSASSGTHITATQVVAGKSVSDEAAQWGQPGITTNPTANNIQQNKNGAAVDTVAADARLVLAFARVGTSTAPTANSNPTTPTGTSWTFPNNSYAFGQLPVTDPVKANCTMSGSDYTCNAGTYAINALTVTGGMGVTFNGPSTITISGGINNGGSKLQFTSGTIKVNGNVTTGSSGIQWGNADVTLGSGTLNFTGTNTFGTGTVTMNAALSIGGGATVTMGAGYHSFNGITLGGGARLTLGAGNLNINGQLAIDGGGSTMTTGAGDVAIGRNNYLSINLSGGSALAFGDGAFSTTGNITTSGGSTLSFGATASHYINGNLDLNGSSTFGAGAYYINGGFTNNSGGSMTGSNVTFVLSGTFTLSGGSTMNLSAPTSDAGGGITDLLIATKSSVATRFGGGSQNVYAGLIYAPNSNMTMDGGAGITGGGRCFMLIVNSFTMNGGTTTGTTCSSLGSSSSGVVELIQ